MSNPFKSKLHFKDVSNQKEQRNNKTNLRFTRPQQSRKSEKVSINLSFQDSRLSSERRFDDSPRPDSGLLPRSSGRIPSLPPSSRLRQGTIAADELALWPLSCPSDLCDHNELDELDHNELDDFCLVSQDKTKLDSQSREAVELLEFLGWKVNHEKCILNPCQELEFLGILWNTRDLMSLPRKKAQRITDLTSEMVLKGRCTLTQIQCLLGHLNFTNFVIHRGRLHCRHLQRFSAQFLQRRPRQKLAITLQAERELRWWQTAMTRFSHLHKERITNFLTTDGADPGWGAQLDGSHISGSWTANQRRWHSNKKEMFAVYATIKKAARHLQDAHILLQTDNRTPVAYIQKEGGTKSMELVDLTYRILQIVEKLEITYNTTPTQVCDSDFLCR